MDRLAQLYADVDRTFLTTLQELDHVDWRERGDVGYWGPVLAPLPGGGRAPRWPDSIGRRVFAYLKMSPTMQELLEALAATGHSTLAFIDGGTPELCRRMEGPTLRVEDRPVDLRHAAAECDAAVLSGGHGTTAELLLAGKPVVQVPGALEQRLMAAATKRLGVGEVARPGPVHAVRVALEGVLDDRTYRDAAGRFTGRYASFDPQRQRRAMWDRAEQLLRRTRSVSRPVPPAERAGERVAAETSLV